jgi:hypothetical protein
MCKDSPFKFARNLEDFHFRTKYLDRLAKFLKTDYLQKVKTLLKSETSIEQAYYSFVLSYNSLYQSHLGYFLMTSQFGDYYNVQLKEFATVFRKYLIFGVFDEINYEEL